MLLLAGSLSPRLAASEPNVMSWQAGCAVPANPRLADLVAEARCGELPVAENPDQPQGRQIQLASSC
jgi:hypothetical protein